MSDNMQGTICKHTIAFSQHINKTNTNHFAISRNLLSHIMRWITVVIKNVRI